MGASEKPAATWHPGDGPTPRTVVDVLREHRRLIGAVGPGGPLWGVAQCAADACEFQCPDPATDAFAQHQADMLAAAGLLATNEPIVVEVHHHDIEKLAEWFNEGYETAVAQGLADDPTLAADWLAEHDREVAARAWDQGVRTTFTRIVLREGLADVLVRNPHRAVGEVP